MGILKNVCSVDSMRQMGEAFNEEACIQTLKLCLKEQIIGIVQNSLCCIFV